MANKKASVDTVRTGIEEITAQGDLLYKGATDLERLPKGTSGQTLKMGSSNEPEWATVATPESPGWTVISSGTVGTSSSPVAFLNLTGITQQYVRVIFYWDNDTVSYNGWDIYARVSTDNGSSWKTGGTDYAWTYAMSTNAYSSSSSATAMKIAASGGTLIADIVNSPTATEYTAMGVTSFYYSNTGCVYVTCGGVYRAGGVKEVTNGVQFGDTGGSRMVGKYSLLSLNV